HNFRVEYDLGVRPIRHGAHGELRLIRRAELAHENHVQGSVQSGRDLRGDGNASPGQRQDDGIGKLHPRQPLPKQLAGLCPLGKYPASHRTLPQPPAFPPLAALAASISSSTSPSRSLPKNISSPTKKVGEPKVPRATEPSVFLSSRSFTAGS